MAGISDLPFRLIAREFGCPLAFTEMVNAQALGLKNRKTLKLLESSVLDRPLGVQLLAREPVHLLEALDVLAGRSFDVIDLNAACPVRKVTRKGQGAALLKEPETLSRLVRTLVVHARVPVTVKIRTGWDPRSVNAIELARRIADAGADAICVHGRTKTQGYTGKADLQTIGAVRAAVSIPVIASGDVLTSSAAIETLKITGCGAVMVARGGLGNPWIYREAGALSRKEPEPERPGLAEINFRKFFAWYTKGLRDARALRPKAMLAETVEEMKTLIGQLQAPAPFPRNSY
jgi:tRNA-dihydrouridine synthase B